MANIYTRQGSAFIQVVLEELTAANIKIVDPIIRREPNADFGNDLTLFTQLNVDYFLLDHAVNLTKAIAELCNKTRRVQFAELALPAKGQHTVNVFTIETANICLRVIEFNPNLEATQFRVDALFLPDAR